MKFETDNQFINENHEGLLDAIVGLESTMSQEWNPDAFKGVVEDFVALLEDHFLHEETVLEGVGYSKLEPHIRVHRQLTHSLLKATESVSDKDSAEIFLKKTRAEILEHELVSDQEYWSVLEPVPDHDNLLIFWDSSLETGNREVDLHHRALVRHLNKFHNVFFASASRTLACAELRSLYAYSELHFEAEEKNQDMTLSEGHKANHDKLLNDLRILISEVEKGDYDLGSVSSHLKYWFLNHLRGFDLPAFRSQ